ncbi:DNA/RNA non-specific endonuclease [Microbacterium sp. JZ31]|uniref:DNA/RNA non-specific endonuclease n=1 Tax=Microbacterium sp. JZ31 TaxID=1906274 RepID=UPI0019328CF7|nr:DNA/RNA non-specific endonuclease [Microbacterium sp. JZ31]
MGKFKPIFDSLSEAALRGARHADAKLPQLARNHGDQLDDWVRRVRGEDRFDDKPDDASRTDAVTTTRGRNAKTTVYDTDSGRPVYEDGKILEDFGGGKRGDNATAIGRLGNKGDDGGHLGAHRFFGDTPDQGIVPQIANLNRGAWKRMENHWAQLVQGGAQVDYSIDVFPPGSIRPERFDVHYIVSDPETGDIISEHTPSFPNEHGATFTP